MKVRQQTARGTTCTVYGPFFATVLACNVRMRRMSPPLPSGGLATKGEGVPQNARVGWYATPHDVTRLGVGRAHDAPQVRRTYWEVRTHATHVPRG